MIQILKHLDIKPSGRSIKLISKLVYEQGEGIDKFKDNIAKLNLERPNIPPPATPTRIENSKFSQVVPKPGKG